MPGAEDVSYDDVMDALAKLYPDLGECIPKYLDDEGQQPKEASIPAARKILSAGPRDRTAQTKRKSEPGKTQPTPPTSQMQ